ncbi:dihydropteroate synthase [Campylobacter insulaenigrae]|uniref:dihydropteroate synthase n=1 Tax=Campylobacter insulaenigrae TaxID=260714 RepID=UPI00242EC9CD|nr:dihydropteroate synthase [Campylobacter insulaenigrae]
MKITKINSSTQFEQISSLIKPHKMGKKIMSKKTQIHFFYIQDLRAPAANILKQDALRVGAELVTHKDLILGKEHTNALLMATNEQIQKLIHKEKMQDFNLKYLAKFLEKSFHKPVYPKLMAILNINNDSFNPQSRVDELNFEKKLNEILELKPDFIDIGAVSSRPGSIYCGEKEEFKRLKNILDLIYKKSYYKESIFSLDSFDEHSLNYALDRGFGLINDITGLANENLAKLAARFNVKYCLMHMQNTPLTMQNNPSYEDVVQELSEFFEKKIAILERYGVKDIFLDVGIGFGKTSWHNMILIKHLEHFLQFQKPLLVGASRKSVIDAYFPSKVEERLAGSLYLHLEAFKNGASIIRTHDLYEHKQMFKLVKAMDEVVI